MQLIASIFTDINRRLGIFSAWLTLVLVVLQVAIVLNRYCFGYSSVLGFGLINYEEALLYFFSMVFLFGAALTYISDEHVRVDILYCAMKPRNQKLVDLVGNIALLMPLVLLILIKSNRNLTQSWSIAESSIDGGLPYVYLWLSMLPLFSISLAAQAIANVIKLTYEVYAKSALRDFALLGFIVAIFGYVFIVSMGWSTEADFSKPKPEWRFPAYTIGVWFTRLSSLAICLWASYSTFKNMNNSTDTQMAEAK